MHIRDPLLVVAPTFDHCLLRAETLIEDADSAVAVAAYKDVASYLVGSKGGDAGAGAGGDVLNSC